MEISKVPPADAASARSGTAPTNRQGSQSAAVAPLGDRADIRPLDIPAALQILLAEVRAAFAMPMDDALMQSPVQAVRELVQVFLQALPEEASNAAAWTAALVRVESAVQSSMERAIGVISQWRDVPPVVVDAARETRSLFFSVIADDLQNPLWLRPEWLGLGPTFRRFWRRRRNARRRLADPDHFPRSLDESEETRS